LYNKITNKRNKGGAKIMGIKKRKHSQEFKEEIVQKALSGERILQLGKEYNISPGLINRWKRQYLDGELSGNNNQEIKKLETQVAKLEQMIGKLTMETIF
jgi:transposase-like protein